MKRAAVIIGVNGVRSLPGLTDAVNGAHRMAQWARQQGMQVFTFTDEAGPLDIGQLKRKIRELVEPRNQKQLLIYFAGHGFNIRYGEYWLLSDAMVDPQAAINLDGTVAQARQSGIPHVVFISDACRTAPEGIAAQFISGSEIFPNDPVGGVENPVDIFFASTLGRPALEVRAQDSAESYSSLYTNFLVKALAGEEREVIESMTVEGRTVNTVKPRRLKTFLQKKLPEQLSALNLFGQAIQVPDARITSDDSAWLSIVAAAPLSLPVSRSGSLFDLPAGARRSPTVSSIVEQLLRDIMSGTQSDIELTAVPADVRADVAAMIGAAAKGTTPAEPTPWAVGGGVRVEGDDIAEIYGAGAVASKVGASGGFASVNNIAGPATSVLVVYGDGSSSVAPIMPGYVTTLCIEQGELVDIFFEPAFSQAQAADQCAQSAEASRLHRVLSGAARLGVLPGRESPSLLGSLVSWVDAHAVDPAIVLYTAYACYEQALPSSIALLRRSFVTRMHVTFFDLALLSRARSGSEASSKEQVVPSFPLLSKGWALMPLTVPLHNGLSDIRAYVQPSLWTKFSPKGTARLRDAIFERRTL